MWNHAIDHSSAACLIFPVLYKQLMRSRDGATRWRSNSQNMWDWSGMSTDQMDFVDAKNGRMIAFGSCCTYIDGIFTRREVMGKWV